jgi:hypothetical protein
MKAFNVVRLHVKPGREEEFIGLHRDMVRDFPGFRRGTLVNTGERSYCFIGEWNDFTSIVEARPRMIAFLDSFRDTLEDLGGDLGVTDAISGEAVLEITP